MDTLACMYYKHCLLTPECCPEFLSSTVQEQLEEHLKQKTVNEKALALNEIKRYDNVRGEVIFRNLMKTIAAPNCWTCGGEKYAYTATKTLATEERCTSCLHINWTLNEIAHRPNMWLLPAANVYITVPFPSNSYKEDEMRACLNYNSKPADYLLTSNKFGKVMESNARERKPELFSMTMWQCKRRERVPPLFNLCKTAICVHLHQVAMSDGEMRSEDPLFRIEEGRIEQKVFYKKGIYRICALNTFLPRKIINELYFWYWMLDRSTNLMNTLNQLEEESSFTNQRFLTSSNFGLAQVY